MLGCLVLVPPCPRCGHRFTLHLNEDAFADYYCCGRCEHAWAADKVDASVVTHLEPFLLAETNVCAARLALLRLWSAESLARVQRALIRTAHAADDLLMTFVTRRHATVIRALRRHHH